MSLVVSVEAGVLCAGVRIFDVPDAPVLICSVVRNPEDHASLLRLAVDKHSAAFLFNELDGCVAWTNAEIGDADGMHLAALLSESPLYSGQFTACESSILDRFCFAIDETSRTPLNGLPLVVHEIPLTIEPWRANHISYVGVGTHNDVVIDSPDEGGIFEAAAWASLEGMFPMSIWRSPTVTIGAKQRELADILAFHRFGTFLVEAKDLAVLSADPLRRRERRVAGTIKQAQKAIGQLVGASKALRRGEVVRDANGHPISPVIAQPMHCIVLLTELMHEGDWTQVERSLRQAISDTGEFFHLLDLSELIYFAKVAGTRSTHFDALLMERFRHFVEIGSVHIRVSVGPDRSGGGR